MSRTSPIGDGIPATAMGFHATHWSVVLTAAAPEDSPQRQAALTALCQTYWYPLYAFVRRQGHHRQEAEDLTQEFIARLLAKDAFASVRREHGLFRSFLLASLKNFLANDWDRQQTVKRGGRYAILSWEDCAGEDRYLREPAHDATPEKLFEQSWALTVIESVLSQLRRDYTAAGKGRIFEVIHAYLEDDGAETYGAMAMELSMTEGAVKMAVLRLREKFRHELRSKIAQTVGDAGEIEEELRHLFASLGK